MCDAYDVVHVAVEAEGLCYLCEQPTGAGTYVIEGQKFCVSHIHVISCRLH